jgi:class 3 adenylate cyclase
MAGLRELIPKSRSRRRQTPPWISRLVQLGVTAENPYIRRRQIFTNIGAFAVALNAFSHLLLNAVLFPWELMPLHIYNAVVTVLALSIHRLHSYGENLGAIALSTLIIGGHTYVVLALGLNSGLQIYFTLAGFLLFIFGIEHWRQFSIFYAAAFLTLIATLYFGRPAGFIMPQQTGFRETLAIQALINTMIINVLLIAYALTALRRAEIELSQEFARSESLIDVILPRAIAARLKHGEERSIADKVSSASIMFADLSGFTAASNAVAPDELVGWLDELFCSFDELCTRNGVDKIKTIGDSYMAVGGLHGDAQPGAVAICRLALEMQQEMSRHKALGSHRLSLRIGIHNGPVVAGVIGDLRVSYDVWGDAVNVAQRMEAHGEPGRIQVSAQLMAMVDHRFAFERRGSIALKGMAETEAWFLTGALTDADKKIADGGEDRDEALQ